MLHPPIDSLLNKINSKYSLVSLAAKRARQIHQSGGDSYLEEYISHKNVGIALEEIHHGKLTLKKN